MAVVYIATGKGGKHYIGRTSGAFHVRRLAHLSTCRNPKPKTLFARALAKHGPESFTWQILADGLSVDESQQVEEALIRLLGTLSPRGYNLTTGGGTVAHHPETRARMSKAQKGRPKPSGFGARVSAALKGRKRTGFSCKGGARKGRVITWGTAISAGLRKLTAEKASSVRMLLALGATQHDVAIWFGVSRPSVSNVYAGKYGYDKVLQEFYLLPVDNAVGPVTV